jgi:hypothetical protein
VGNEVSTEVSTEVKSPAHVRQKISAPVVVVAALLVPLLVTRVRLASSLNVNWDELFFLSRVHSWLRGDLSEKLLTFHVHFFSWVATVSPNEIDQVIALRHVMLGCGLVAAVSTAIIGWKLLDSGAGALFAVFAGQSCSLLLNHGASARYDPIIVALFLAAAALLVGHTTTRRREKAVAAGVLFACALLVSIKAAFYLPSLLGLLLIRVVGERSRKDAAVDVVVFCCAAGVAGVALFAGHVASLAAPVASAGHGSGDLGSIFSRVLLRQEFPEPTGLLLTLRWDGAFWLLVLAGFALVFVRVGARRDQLQQAQLLCFLLPLGAIALYRNSHAYFADTVLPPAALLAGVVVARIDRRLGRQPMLAAGLILLVALPGSWAAWRWNRLNSDDQVTRQRVVVDAVHQVFPSPVPYVDRCSMIAGYPKIGPFMSTWGLSSYRERAQPIMRSLLQANHPQFLLTNVVGLELSRSFENTGKAHRLLKEDFTTLQENFIPWWGPLWIAGKTITIAQADVDVDVVIAGSYVLEGGPLVIDGRPLAPGSTVELSEGRHRASAARPTTARLRTAAAQPPPTSSPPAESLFTGFEFRTRARAAVVLAP